MRVAWFFFFKQKTAYEMRISDWSSDVCSSDLRRDHPRDIGQPRGGRAARLSVVGGASRGAEAALAAAEADARGAAARHADPARDLRRRHLSGQPVRRHVFRDLAAAGLADPAPRSEEHTSELKSLMRTSYADLCFEKKKK